MEQTVVYLLTFKEKPDERRVYEYADLADAERVADELVFKHCSEIEIFEARLIECV